MWKFDPQLGAVQVKDIAAGTNSSSPTGLTNANGVLYFSANDGSAGTELWKSDGTSAGTTLVKDIQPGAVGSVPQNIAQIRSSKRVLFSAIDPAAGLELWISDGTANGTTLLQNIATSDTPVPANASPASFTQVGTTIFFSANDGRQLGMIALLSQSVIALPSHRRRRSL